MKTLEDRLGVVADGVTTIWNNQVELSQSASKVDEQFCVLVRLVVSNLNTMISAHNDRPLSDRVEPVTYEAINTLFQEFEDFRKRSDFREHFRSWYMGDDIRDLPELKEDARDTVTDASQEKDNANQGSEPEQLSSPEDAEEPQEASVPEV